MTALDRAIGYLAPHAALRRARQRAAIALLTAHAVPFGHARSYEGARLGRRTDGWIVSGASANTEIGPALTRLRDRSRDLVRNNPYAAKAVQAVVSNLVGTGIMPRAGAKARLFTIRWIHVPLLSACGGFRWTDTTQGFRAYSRKMLLDPRIAPFRDVFATYELLAYLSYRAPRLGYRCIELPTIRRYPKGEVPTKISSVNGNLSVLAILMRACTGRYDPEKTA